MTRWQRPRTENPWQKRSRKEKEKLLDAMASLHAVSPNLTSSPLDTPAPIQCPDQQTILPPLKKRRGRPKSNNPKPVKPKKPVNPFSERMEQRGVVAYCEKRGYPFFAIPNGARRSFWEAMEAKKSGMKAGVPDLCFPVPLHGFGGMYIEMKRREGGVVSPIQRYWIALLHENNYKVAVCMGSDEALTLIDSYFEGWKGLSDDVKSMLQEARFTKGDGK